MRKTSHLISRWIAFAMTGLVALSAQAISFTPIEMDFSPAGRGATQVFRLENTTPEPAAVEVTIKSRKMALNGDDVLNDAEDDFNIFPAQVVLQPGQVQTVRVQYVGASDLQAEKAYRLIAEQLPIDVGQAPQNGGRMRLLVKYVASAYVVPRDVKVVLAVTEAKVIEEPTGRWLQVQVRNDGTTRKILKGVRLVVGDITLQGAQLKGLEGENLLAGTTRVFRVPAPQGLVATPASVRLLVE
jgi:fimbrial chaperone protein